MCATHKAVQSGCDIMKGNQMAGIEIYEDHIRKEEDAEVLELKRQGKRSENSNQPETFVPLDSIPVPMGCLCLHWMRNLEYLLASLFYQPVIAVGLRLLGDGSVYWVSFQGINAWTSYRPHGETKLGARNFVAEKSTSIRKSYRYPSRVETRVAATRKYDKPHRNSTKNLPKSPQTMNIFTTDHKAAVVLERADSGDDEYAHAGFCEGIRIICRWCLQVAQVSDTSVYCCEGMKLSFERGRRASDDSDWKGDAPRKLFRDRSNSSKLRYLKISRLHALNSCLKIPQLFKGALATCMLSRPRFVVTPPSIPHNHEPIRKNGHSTGEKAIILLEKRTLQLSPSQENLRATLPKTLKAENTMRTAKSCGRRESREFLLLESQAPLSPMPTENNTSPLMTSTIVLAQMTMHYRAHLNSPATSNKPYVETRVTAQSVSSHHLTQRRISRDDILTLISPGGSHLTRRFKLFGNIPGFMGLLYSLAPPDDIIYLSAWLTQAYQISAKELANTSSKVRVMKTSEDYSYPNQTQFKANSYFTNLFPDRVAFQNGRYDIALWPSTLPLIPYPPPIKSLRIHLFVSEPDPVCHTRVMPMKVLMRKHRIRIKGLPPVLEKQLQQELEAGCVACPRSLKDSDIL
ncbi:uncharacterized protein BDR25DRAFT_363095 [Lindgomyces ingoldianus]|uniref:Uncharacterized protein n=1 Tax=Lindgomyces ingoldianus TaxID=673940 RepID=A0ACB6Q8I3_9PLEO|nr:uncharacterized protein BDR25DRAFT_363095 [Lindgomyces ingoldianus]KAF2463194.1 hypothetical protein BDR25DRAFT_363095 [Lindgomyces ingoldianus]